MDVYYEETSEGWFYQIEDEDRQGPFPDQPAAEKHIHDRIADSLAGYTREMLFGT